MCRYANRHGAVAEIYTTNLDGLGTHPVRCGRPVETDSTRITYFPVAASTFYKISPTLAMALRRKIPHCDILHIHSLYQFPSSIAAYYCRHFKVPYILRPHGTLDPYLFRRHRARKWLYELLVERRNLRHAAAVHFVTEEEMRLANKSRLQFKGVVVPFGVELEEIARNRNPATMVTTWPETAGKQVILFFGRINFKKGLELLVKAFGQIARERDDVVLMIAGPDSDGLAVKVRSWLADEGVLGKAIFTGMVRDLQKKAVLAGASMFVLPSYTENFGIAVVEAMASGLPVVISDSVNIATEVEKGGAGLVVSTNAAAVAYAIKELLDNPASAKRMGESGRDLVCRQFSWEMTGPKLMDLYERIAANSPRKTRESRFDRMGLGYPVN
jgi:glycosyltransferase involved in cell wall biosynthesis